MNNLLKKALLLALIGMACGAVISLCFVWASGIDRYVENGDYTGLIIYIVVGSLYGAIPVSTTVFYEIEKWSLLRATISHFLVTFISFYAVAILDGWFEPWSKPLYITLAIMVAVYFVIWITNYMHYKRVVDDMNEELKHMKEEDSDKNID